MVVVIVTVVVVVERIRNGVEGKRERERGRILAPAAGESC